MKKYIIWLAAATLSLSSCNDDFLQQDPIQELAEGSFLKNSSDLPLYLNSLYPLYITGHQSGNAYEAWAPYGIQGSPIAYGDLVSDNLVGYTGAAGNPINRLDNSFTVPNSGTTTGWEWNNLKKVNYFLSHCFEASGPVADIEKYAAEAYFFKAWDYYKKLSVLGEVPWLTNDLNVDSPELYSARTPREQLADSILWCLDYAVDHLKSDGAADGRINRDMANFLKARFCLFEGTFRKYHKNDAAPMPAVPGNENKFLQACVEACEAIMSSPRNYRLYRNEADKAADGTNNSYWKMFTFRQNPTADNNTEAILTRVYDGDKLASSFTRYYIMGANAAGRYSFGATKGLLDEYLCIDGKPITDNPNFKGYDGGDWRELDNRDPRLKMTVVKPGEYITVWTRDRKGDYAAGTLDPSMGIYYPSVTYNCPSANQTEMMRSTVTGYAIIKHWTPDTDDYPMVASAQSATMFRYGEVLLMLAEAKAELGTLDQATVDITINKLRERAGFPESAYLKVNAIPADPRLDKIYAEKLDYTVSPLLREVRRERRVEMMMEGLRREDLIRWKAGRLMEVPLRGMKFTEEKQAIYDGSNKDKDTRKAAFAYQAKLNTDVFVDGDGFIIGFPKASRITDGTLVWDDKYYYFPIPLQELSLNPNLTQSPGWQDIPRN
ncbi:MAG: RagB/SusD family nutrient uptake outer membrane protein [Bacteroides sp.]|nr:RagB/SusD family nutrient uptake outer membrane protein [Bacteroides sp.]